MNSFDPYHQWLAIPPAEQPPNHYRLLGITVFESDRDVIEAATDRQMGYIRQCATGPHIAESQQILNELAAARVCLLDPEKKAAYDQKLKTRLAGPATAQRQPARRRPVQQATADDEFAAALPPRVRSKQKSGSGAGRAANQRNFVWIYAGAGFGCVVLIAFGAYFLTRAGSAGPEIGNALRLEAGPATKETPHRAKSKPPAEVASATPPDVKSGSGENQDSPAAPPTEPVAGRSAVPERAKPAPLSPEGKGFTNSLGMRLQLIPKGEFQMGLDEDPAKLQEDFPSAKSTQIDAERPQHAVRINSFYMGAHEVTTGQFLEFCELSGYPIIPVKKDEKKGWGYDPDRESDPSLEVLPWAPGWLRSDDQPVVYVSWNDAQAFSNWLSRKEQRSYRLPTEAEWEYCCRAGTTTRYSSGNNPEDLVKVANIADESLRSRYPNRTLEVVQDDKSVEIPFPYLSGSDGYWSLAPVGSLAPNPFALWDMHGNVMEWCSDAAVSEFYAKSPVDNPHATGGPSKTIRGGSWMHTALGARSAYRASKFADTKSKSDGFRIACDVEGAPRTGAPLAGQKPSEQKVSSTTDLKTIVSRLANRGAQLIYRTPEKGAQIHERFHKLPSRFTIDYLAILDASPAEFEAVCKAQIRRLSLYHDEQLTDAQLAILPRVKGLRELALPQSAFTDAGLAHLADCRELTTLTLRDTSFSPTGWKHLRRIPKLVTLRAIAGTITAEHLAELVGHSTLKSIVLSHCDLAGDSFAGFRDKSQLESLELNVRQLNPAVLEGIRDNLPSLKHLHLKSTNSSLDRDGFDLLRGMTALQDTQISLAGLTDSDLASLLSALSTVSTIDLRWMPITGSAFANVPERLPKLTNCNLQRTQLDDDGLNGLVGAAPNLIDLDLSRTRVTNDGLRQLEGLAALENLRLLGLELNEESIKCLKILKKLKTLGVTKSSLSAEVSGDLKTSLRGCIVTIH